MSSAVTLSTMPRLVTAAVSQIKKDPVMSEGIMAMMDRKGEFESELAAMLVGIAAVPQSRKHLDKALDTVWGRAKLPATPRFVPEVVIGAGLHAAIYCAVRVQNGHPKPLVLEARDTVGGALGRTSSATFYLNSRNRPGRLGAPGDPTRALNVLPGSLIQPSDLSSDEYQRNSDVGFIIRMMLALYAEVVPGVTVTTVNRTRIGTGKYTLTTSTRRDVSTNRVIVATGLGQDTYIGMADGKRVMTFDQFMDHMNQTFPLRDLRRIGVLGNGDGGKTVIEAMTGQGPNDHWSMASLDYVERIDWWDAKFAEQNCYYKAGWEGVARSRYKGIGRVLPLGSGGDSNERGRVMPIRKNASYVEAGYSVATIDDQPYDLVIDCRGYDLTNGIGSRLFDDYQWQEKFSKGGTRIVGRRLANDTSGSIFKVGPVADINVRNTEAGRGIPENSTSLFRYADRTAQLASELA